MHASHLTAQPVYTERCWELQLHAERLRCWYGHMHESLSGLFMMPWDTPAGTGA